MRWKSTNGGTARGQASVRVGQAAATKSINAKVCRRRPLPEQTAAARQQIRGDRTAEFAVDLRALLFAQYKGCTFHAPTPGASRGTYRPRRVFAVEPARHLHCSRPISIRIWSTSRPSPAPTSRAAITPGLKGQWHRMKSISCSSAITVSYYVSRDHDRPNRPPRDRVAVSSGNDAACVRSGVAPMPG